MVEIKVKYKEIYNSKKERVSPFSKIIKGENKNTWMSEKRKKE